MNKILKVSIIGIFTMSLISGCGCEKNTTDTNITDETPKVNTEENVVKDQTVDVFSLENTSLIYSNGTSTLETTVTNTASETAYLSEFTIDVKDESGNIIITLVGFIGDSLGAGETRVITSSCGIDLSNAKSIEYTVQK
ncbi:MAG: hypothetical protein ACK5HP_04320 [Bacilli bacterium]